MRLLQSALTLLASLVFVSSGLAQTTSAINQSPWWGYKPVRIANSFSTIIGLPGTALVPNSTNREWTTHTNDMFIDLPFPFTFMQVNYPQGYRLIVQHQGWMSFSGYTTSADLSTNGSIPRLQYWGSSHEDYRTWNQMIAPFWSDLQTADVYNPQGGVYWRVDGIAGERVLTIEWRVRGGLYEATSPSGFQVKLFEETSAIEFHYAANSIDRTVPQSGFIPGYGALIGLRNTGQYYIPRELTLQDFDNDYDNFLYFLHPEQVVAGQSPGSSAPAFTRANTFNQWNVMPYHPVDHAFSESYGTSPETFYIPSPLFHYSFPEEDGQPIGYGLVPIKNDVACESFWLVQSNGVNAYPAGTNVQVGAQFVNRASNVKEDIEVIFDVYYGEMKTKVYTSEVRLVSPGSYLNSDQVIFNAIPGDVNPDPANPSVSRSGAYEVRVYSRDPLEENFKSDTGTMSYFILGGVDMQVSRIMQPFENLPPLFTQYSPGIGVPVKVRVANLGIAPASGVKVGYKIVRQGETVPVYTTEITLPGQFLPATYQDVGLPAWTPVQSGCYMLQTWVDLTGDQNPANDKAPLSLGQTVITVSSEVELEAVDIGVRPFIAQEYVAGGTFEVAASFINNGTSNATNVPATVIIRDPQGNEVYNQTIILPTVEGNGTQILQAFPDFVSSVSSDPGRYTVTATVSGLQDPVAVNNSATWTFILTTDPLLNFNDSRPVRDAVSR